MIDYKGHNPYFNRWFSAMCKSMSGFLTALAVTILILIDGFLQSDILGDNINLFKVTILILIDGFLQ